MNERAVTFGVISDTHMPQRLKRLPDAVFEVLEGVDLIVHAGDVGELRVLDELSRIAPVVAVHGNDDTDEATGALPYALTLTAAGQRILVTHGHFTDPILESAQRADDRWPTSFARWASRAQEHAATVMIYGHSHIPSMAYHGGVWLINPGAVASSSVAYRQAVKTVARVVLTPHRPPQAAYFDLAQPDVPHRPPDDYEAGFADFYRRYAVPIFAPDLMAQEMWVRDELIAAAGAERIAAPLLPLAHECWDGTRASISAQDAAVLWAAQDSLPHGVLEKLRAHPVFGRYL